jgi:hypothetical protein
VTKTINPDLAKYGTQLQIPFLGGVTVDFDQYNGGVKVASDASWIGGSVNGTFFDANKVEHYTFEPAAFNIRNPAGKSAQGYIADYVTNTLL